MLTLILKIVIFVAILSSADGYVYNRDLNTLKNSYDTFKRAIDSSVLNYVQYKKVDFECVKEKINYSNSDQIKVPFWLSQRIVRIAFDLCTKDAVEYFLNQMLQIAEIVVKFNPGSDLCFSRELRKIKRSPKFSRKLSKQKACAQSNVHPLINSLMNIRKTNCESNEKYKVIILKLYLMANSSAEDRKYKMKKLVEEFRLKLEDTLKCYIGRLTSVPGKTRRMSEYYFEYDETTEETSTKIPAVIPNSDEIDDYTDEYDDKDDNEKGEIIGYDEDDMYKPVTKDTYKPESSTKIQDTSIITENRYRYEDTTDSTTEEYRYPNLEDAYTKINSEETTTPPKVAFELSTTTEIEDTPIMTENRFYYEDTTESTTEEYRYPNIQDVYTEDNSEEITTPPKEEFKLPTTMIEDTRKIPTNTYRNEDSQTVGKYTDHNRLYPVYNRNNGATSSDTTMLTTEEFEYLTTKNIEYPKTNTDKPYGYDYNQTTENYPEINRRCCGLAFYNNTTMLVLEQYSTTSTTIESDFEPTVIVPTYKRLNTTSKPPSADIKDDLKKHWLLSNDSVLILVLACAMLTFLIFFFILLKSLC
jgi:hypothetical protein